VGYHQNVEHNCEFLAGKLLSLKGKGLSAPWQRKCPGGPIIWGKLHSEKEIKTMNASPGHQKYPDHKVKEEFPNIRMEVFFNNEKIADSTNVIRVIEDKHPVRHYIPREDVRMENLVRTSLSTECPFKGSASYYTIKVGDRESENAVWSYETPYDEHQDLKDRLAFYSDKVDQIKISPVEIRTLDQPL
jgi:uncharacterized protein (DUF427 family)